MTTDIPGRRRFVTTIARRLAQLGALTKGSKEASGQALFGEYDNLENDIAERSLRHFLELLDGNTWDRRAREMQERTGFTWDELGHRMSWKVDGNTGKPKLAAMTMKDFLNRILVLDPESQHAVWDAYWEIYTQAVDRAKDLGIWNVGTEVYHADQGIELVRSQQAFEKDGRTVDYYEFNTKHTRRIVTQEIMKEGFDYYGSPRFNAGDKVRFLRNKRSKQLYAAVWKYQRSSVFGSSSKVVFMRPDPKQQQEHKESEITVGDSDEHRYVVVPDEEAWAEWDEIAEKEPKIAEIPIHMLNGSLLDVWQRLPKKFDLRILTTNEGDRYLGAVIPDDELQKTLENLGVGRPEVKVPPPETMLRMILDEGYTAILSNDWRIHQATFAHETRAEVVGPGTSQGKRDLGLKDIWQGSRNRWYVPSAEVIENLLRSNDVVEWTKGHTTRGTDLYSGLPPMSQWVGKLLGWHEQSQRDVYIPDELREKGETEERKETARRGLQTENWRDRARKAAENIVSERKHFKHLPRRGPLAHAADMLRVYEGARSWATKLAVDTVEGIAGDLSPQELVVFTDFLATEDILKDIEAGLYDPKPENVPFGYTHRRFREIEGYEPGDRIDIEETMRRLTAIVEHTRNRPIKEAIQRRRRMEAALKSRLVELDILNESVLEEPRYYHRQVLEYRNAEKRQYVGAGGGVDLHIRQKGFQRRRVGGGDFNLQYAEAEYEWLAQAYGQIAKHEVLQRLEKMFNLKGELVRTARSGNEAAVRRKLAEKEAKGATTLEEVYERWRLEPTHEPYWIYRSRIARAGNELVKLIVEPREEDGMVPASARFDDLLEQLREAWLENKGINADRDPEDREPFVFDHADWWSFLAFLAGQPEGTPGRGQARGIFKAIREREEFTKETLGTAFKTWEDEIPEGHVAWQPKPGKHMFFASTITEEALERVLAGVKALENKDVRKMLVVGGSRETWVIPEALATTLDKFHEARVDSGLEAILREAQTAWKQWVLLNPLRFLRYNLNNMTGDLDITLAFNPVIVTKYFGQAAVDLGRYQYNRPMKKSVRDEITEALRLAVVDSGLTVHEIPDIRQEGVLRHVFSSAPNANAIQKLSNRYWSSVRNFTVWRENILRLAAFRYFREQTAAGRRVYGASVRSEIDAISDPVERAAKLARELIGDYGNISHAGQWLRSKLIPFYSWMEINLPRYVRLIQNLPHEETAPPGTKVRVALGASADIGLRAGIFALKAHILFLVVQLWNRLRYPEENKLVNRNRDQQHLILGRDRYGQIVSVRFDGALADALRWFDAEDYPDDLVDVFQGRKDLSEIVMDAPRGTINRFFNGLNPIISTSYELIAGKSLWPSIWRQRTVRDPMGSIASSLSVYPIYKAIRNGAAKIAPEWVKPLPARKRGRGDEVSLALANLLTYRTDAGEAAYWRARSMAWEWEDRHGQPYGGSGKPSKRTLSLYYWRMAVRFGDFDAAEVWLMEYQRLGGTSRGLKTSLRMAAPGSNLSKKQYREFMRDLSSDERDDFKHGLDWYRQSLKQWRDNGQR